MQMLTTIQALLNLDGALFERLANEVLRHKFAVAANLIASGINAQGKTIKGSSDGFCQAEQDHYATIHHTTQRNLKRKWLYNGASKTTPKGDLVKAIATALVLKGENSRFRFTVFLVTNNSVPESLYQEVMSINTRPFINVIVVEQSIICSFLDTSPQGQYLRKVYLHIDAELLSKDLLNEVIQTNLHRYKSEMYLDDDVLVSTKFEKKVNDQVEQSSKTVNLLLGESDFGKSTVAYSMMRSNIGMGKTALRITGRTVEQSQSLTDAIIKQLIADHPELYVQPDSYAALFSNALLVIDDINKSTMALALLDKIISWGEISSVRGIKVLCPVWPKNLSLLENKAAKEECFAIVKLDKPSYLDCADIIKHGLKQSGIMLTDQQIRSIVTDSSGDPLLLSLCTKLINEKGQYWAEMPKEVINNFVEDKLRLTAENNRQPVFVVKQCIEKLGKAMMLNRRFDPDWLEINTWFREQPDIEVINEIAIDRQLFYFDDEGKCFFRHDRVREHMLSLGITSSLNNFELDTNLLNDPFFAELIGNALAASHVTPDFINSLIDVNPLAVFYSLKFLQGAERQERFEQTIHAIQTWNALIKVRNIPDAVTLDIARILLGFDTKDINKITVGLPESLEMTLAKFRNGNWLSGVNFFSYFIFFSPTSPNYWRDSVIAHVKAKYENVVLQGLTTSLPANFTPDGIKHAYTLAGFMRSTLLMQPLSKSWDKYAKPENYVAYLWAILNCFSQDYIDIVKNALQYWCILPEHAEHKGLNNAPSKKGICSEIHQIYLKLTNNQTDLLLTMAQDQKFLPILATILTQVDLPKAFDVVLQQESKREDVEDFCYNQLNSRWDFKKTNKRLSQLSLNFLRAQFRDRSQSANRRYLAWRYWSGNEETNTVIDELNQVAPDDEVLYKKSILFRANQKDLSVVPLLLQLIENMPTAIHWIYDVWNADANVYFRRWFASALESQDARKVEDGLEQLMAVNNQDATDIIVENWHSVKKYHKAIVAALYLSNPVTRQLARIEINRLGFSFFDRFEDYYTRNLTGMYWDSEISKKFSSEEMQNIEFLLEEFKYLPLHYGCRYEGIKDRITIEKLETLVPYFPLLNSHALLEFAQDCQRLNRKDWCIQHIIPHLDRDIKARIYPDKNDIIFELNEKHKELAMEHGTDIIHWTEELEKRGVQTPILLECLLDFGKHHNTLNALYLVCKILEEVGTRMEIPIIEKFEVDSTIDTSIVESLKANAVYTIKRNRLQ